MVFCYFPDLRGIPKVKNLVYVTQFCALSRERGSETGVGFPENFPVKNKDWLNLLDQLWTQNPDRREIHLGKVFTHGNQADRA